MLESFRLLKKWKDEAEQKNKKEDAATYKMAADNRYADLEAERDRLAALGFLSILDDDYIYENIEEKKLTDVEKA